MARKAGAKNIISKNKEILVNDLQNIIINNNVNIYKMAFYTNITYQQLRRFKLKQSNLLSKIDIVQKYLINLGFQSIIKNANE